MPRFATQIEQIEAVVTVLEKQLMAWHKSNPVSQRLATIPGIGPIIATAVAAMVAEPRGFRSGREFAAWLSLMPRQNSAGFKTGWAAYPSEATSICDGF
jgi:transposase